MADGAVGDRRAAGKSELTIEQLATETGMSVRNIRSYRSRRLLPAPVVRAGIGYYGEEHVARIRRIVELQAQGLKLSAIERLFASRRPSYEQLAEITGAVIAPFETESPEELSRDELIGRVGAVSERELARAQRAGLIVAVGDGLFEAPSPGLLRAVEEVVARGVPFATALSVHEKVRRSCEAISRTFVQLFVEDVWRPFDEAGLPADRWHEVTAAIERLRMLAAEVLLAQFNQTMEEEVERAFGEIVEELSARGRELGAGGGEPGADR
jgi:DNA-binding transcriptional MerR regulator